MDSPAVALLGAAVGIVVGAGLVLAWQAARSRQRRVPAVAGPVVPPGVAAVLAVLRSSALVVGPEDEVLKASDPAHMMGLVNGSRVASQQLLDWVREVRRDGQIREGELVLKLGRGQLRYVAARVAPLGSRLVLALVEDRTREKQADEIRRDFVANVSHELKTPIGALMLLSEAVSEAADDPTAVHRFAARMRMESERLIRLVQQILELSRLQADASLDQAERVSVDVLMQRAMDRIGVDAADKGVQLTTAGPRGLAVRGDGDQLVVALGNLVENAVVYSPPGSRVAVSARRGSDGVEISVTDRGPGIPAGEIHRIFERFYRVDPARARATGGTGLGLSIVKHIAAVHGGDIRVWSVEGEGSTFTLTLPTDDTATEATEPGPDQTRPSHPVVVGAAMRTEEKM